MDEKTPVDMLYDEYQLVNNALMSANMLSESSAYSNTMRKVFILSCGSFFEYEMTQMLKNFACKVSNNNEYVSSFLERQAIRQKYHTLFSWGQQDKPEAPGRSAKTFFKLFGDIFEKKMSKQIEDDDELERAVLAFLELGHLRNILVHSNFAEYSYEQKTIPDVYELYKKALQFIPWVNKELLSP